MKKITTILFLIIFITGCGGLKYIKLDEKSDTEWKTEENTTIQKIKG
ncbi:uncharacterized protein Dvar_47570 [Desulfosarcina variabilis str. Montpellier]